MNHPKTIKSWHFIPWINQHLHLPVFHQSVHHLKTTFISLTEKCMCETNCVCLCLIWSLIFFQSVATSIHISTYRNTKQNLRVCKLLFFERRPLRDWLPYFVCWVTKLKLYYVMRFFIELIFALQIFPSSPPVVVCPVCPVCSILGVNG